MMLVINAKDQPINEIRDNVDELINESSHLSYYFPEDSNEIITFTAGGGVNTFGAWAEIVDNNAVTFSSKVASDIGHISLVSVEQTSVADKVYILEIAYGATKVIITRHRVLVGAGRLSSAQTRVRALKIPAGETVYYRMKCETAGATAQVALRYHLC